MIHFKEFLDKNPTEVVVFIFEITDDVDQPVNMQDFYFLFVQIRGFIDMMYVHDGPGSPWPTLRELTDPAYEKTYNRVSFALHLVYLSAALHPIK